MNSLVARWLAIVVGVVIVAVAIGLYVNKLVRAPTPIAAGGAGKQLSRRVRLWLGVATLGASALSFTSLAGAEFPGHNGRIAFMRYNHAGIVQTWVADANLGNQVQLTSGPANSGWAVWSPGGDQLAFDSDRADPDRGDSHVINDIFTMSPDASNVVKLTNSQHFSGDAAWSPNGSLIAFDSDRGEKPGKLRIYVMGADGTNPRRITKLPPNLPAKGEGDASPRFSPDGKRLLFIRYRGEQNSADPSALFTVRLDGSGMRRLSPWRLSANDADWSPGAKRLVFEAYPDPKSHGEIYTVHADGRHLKNLTHDGHHAGAADPVWSPDGRKILFLDARAVKGAFKNGLATMRPNGTARHFVSPTPMREHQPDWESAP